MNKMKMVLAVTGGVIGLVVLVLAFLTWRAYSAKSAALEGDDEEGVDGLETVVSRAETLSRKPVYPCKASVTAIESNRTLVATWNAEARKLAAGGDKAFEPTTPAAFKSFIVEDARRLSSLPGTAGGKLTKPEFAFGPFQAYITEGKMPTEEELGELQRRWDDVATVVDTLAQSGIAELLEVKFKAAAEEKEEDNRRGSRNNRARAAGKAAKAEAAPANGPAAFSYVFTFSAKPEALVRAVNALEVGARFTVVDDFSLTRTGDGIADALSGEGKKDSRSSSSRRRRRRGGDAEPEPAAAEEASKGGVVTDPLADDPLTVALTVTVYDFRSAEKGEQEEKKEKEGAEK